MENVLTHRCAQDLHRSTSGPASRCHVRLPVDSWKEKGTAILSLSPLATEPGAQSLDPRSESPCSG